MPLDISLNLLSDFQKVLPGNLLFALIYPSVSSMIKISHIRLADNKHIPLYCVQTYPLKECISYMVYHRSLSLSE
jgi:hypothetical protein